MREIGFLYGNGVVVSHACKTSRGGGAHPMKERAIVIIELEGKEEEKKRAVKD
jgi:hypothetical protein